MAFNCYAVVEKFIVFGFDFGIILYLIVAWVLVPAIIELREKTKTKLNNKNMGRKEWLS